MDPAPISSTTWQLIDTLDAAIVAFVVSVILAGFSFLLANAIIPSLTITGQAPLSIRIQRPFLYVISFISLVLTIYQVVHLIRLLSTVINDIYPRWFI